jgi:hypothetical protein
MVLQNITINIPTVLLHLWNLNLFLFRNVPQAVGIFTVLKREVRQAAPDAVTNAPTMHIQIPMCVE